MTCKDCVHYEVCAFKDLMEIFRNGMLKEILMNKVPCHFFKNKADFVEVVRCPHCFNGGEINQCGDVYCTLHRGWFDKDNYCSYGERKTNNE